MTTSIKITALTDIAGAVAYGTIVPVVNMAGTPITERANLQIIGNLFLNGAGGANFVAAAQAITAGTVTTAAQANITSVGTLTSLGVTGGISAATVSATTFTGALSGAATTAGTVTTAAQPNITSVGTLTGVVVSGTTNLGDVGNVIIAGGTDTFVLSTDGFGTLSWVAKDSGASGFSGFSGISGYSGDSGISGYSGDSGISGYSGDSGISGYSGAPITPAVVDFQAIDTTPGVTDTYIIVGTEDMVTVDSAGDYTAYIVLPITAVVGKQFIIKKATNNALRPVSISAAGGKFIDGDTTVLFNNAWGQKTVAYDSHFDMYFVTGGRTTFTP